jgi:hypothetical protein
VLATIADLHGSDPAGNALAQAYATVETVLLWALLLALVITASVAGALPTSASITALVLLSASGFAAMTALGLLAEPALPPHLWPILVPALVPPLVVAYCGWALVPVLRAAVPPGLAAGTVWGTTLLLCVAVVPFVRSRGLASEQAAAARVRYDDSLARVPAGAPLWKWTPFLATRDETKVSAVLEHIRHLDRRQGDAETMLDRGDFPLPFLGSFDLEPTPSLCDKARALLRRRAAARAPNRRDSRPYAEIAEEVAGAVAAMEWLVDYDCPCEAESRVWEAAANGYRKPNFDVVRFAELRDPKRLGRALRDDPARFSMLTPAAHLRAWLKFADQQDLRDAALAGARQLDHRTADAVEMLGENDHAAWTVLRYLPALDLEATPPLCESALSRLHREFESTYRPAADDPRPYAELLDRLGNGAQFAALKWLAEHGCAAEAELTEAEALVRAYQDSPDNAAMLQTLKHFRGRAE